jgi:hypothetical protein
MKAIQAFSTTKLLDNYRLKMLTHAALAVISRRPDHGSEYLLVSGPQDLSEFGNARCFALKARLS